MCFFNEEQMPLINPKNFHQPSGVSSTVTKDITNVQITWSYNCHLQSFVRYLKGVLSSVLKHTLSIRFLYYANLCIHLKSVGSWKTSLQLLVTRDKRKICCIAFAFAAQSCKCGFCAWSHAGPLPAGRRNLK